MIAQKIENPGRFMKCLLIKDTFDRFLVSDVTVTTFVSFHIDGQYHPEFYSGEDVTPQEAENIPDGNQIEWKSVRPFVFSGADAFRFLSISYCSIQRTIRRPCWMTMVCLNHRRISTVFF